MQTLDIVWLGYGQHGRGKEKKRTAKAERHDTQYIANAGFKGG